MQGGRKEALGGLGVAPVGEVEVERRAVFVDRAVEVLPAALELAHRSTFSEYTQEGVKDRLIEVLRADYDDTAWQAAVERARRLMQTGTAG